MNAPIVRLTLDHMKAEIIQTISSHQMQVSEEVQRAVSHAVDNFDYEGEVGKIAQDAIREAVKSYFSWGPGKTTVTEAVHAALGDVLRLRKEMESGE